MKSNMLHSISEIKYEVVSQNESIITGSFGNSSGSFKCRIFGSGNNKTHEVELTGGQYDMGAPTIIKITGEWEMQEVAELFNLITTNNHV